MQNSEEKAKVIPPYLPYASFMKFVDSLAMGVPTRIDRSLMKAMSGTQQSQIMQTLRYFDLIDNYGNVHAALEELAISTGEERSEILGHLLRQAYDFFFTPPFDLKRATVAQLEERFRQSGATGETVRKCQTFFVNMARAAKVELSTFIVNHSTIHRSPTSRSPAKPRAAQAKSKSRRQSPPDINGAKPNGHHTPPPVLESVTWEEQLLSKFPSFEPSWPDEVKAQWFAGFGQLLDLRRAEPVGVGAQPDESEAQEWPE